MKIVCLNLADRSDLREYQRPIKEYFNDNFSFYSYPQKIFTEKHISELVNNNEISAKSIGFRKNNAAAISEYDAFMKHKEIWKLIKDEPFLIYEDSYKFDINKFNKNITFLNNEVLKYDIIYCNNIYYLNDNNLYGNGLSYIITPEGAKKLLENTKLFNIPLDLYIRNQCNDFIYNYYIIDYPFLERDDINIKHSTEEVIPGIDLNYRQDFINPICNKFTNINTKKFAIIASHPNLSTGYANIGTQIANHLCDYFDVIYLGFQNFHEKSIDRDIKSNIKIYDLYDLDKESLSGFGDKAIIPILKEEKPDYILIYNDHGVCSSVLKIIKEINSIKLCYLDLVYEYQYSENIDYIKNNCDKVIAFSDSWNEHLTNFYNINNVITLYHGLNKINNSTLLTREQLGFKEDDFVILSLNRNDSRKNIDIVIETFLIFFKNNNKDNIYLYIICNFNNGLNIREYIKLQCKILNLNFDKIINNNIITYKDHNRATDNYIHSLYRECDVGISITSGEGFGLTVMEQLMYNKPVICSRLKIFEELIGKDYPLFVDSVCEGYNYDNLGGIKKYFKSDGFLQKLQQIYDTKPNIIIEKDFIKKFNWKIIIKNFILSLNNKPNNIINNEPNNIINNEPNNIINNVPNNIINNVPNNIINNVPNNDNQVKNKDLKIAFVTGYIGAGQTNIPKISKDVDSYFITNNKDIANKLELDNVFTEVILINNIPVIDSNESVDNYIKNSMWSKKLKVFPHTFLWKKYDFIIWYDNKINPNLNNTFNAINSWNNNNALVLYKHLFLNNVKQEFEESMKQPRYYAEKEKYIKYIDYCKTLGLADDYALHSQTGFIIYNLNHYLTEDIQKEWMKHINMCGIECQISFNLIRQKYEEYIGNFNGKYDL